MFYNKYKELVFLILLFTFILEYDLLIVSQYTMDRIIKLGSLFLLITFFFEIKGNHKNYYIKKVIKYYFVWLLFIFISVAINFSTENLNYLFKYFLMSIPLVLLLYMVNPYKFSEKIIKFPIFIGVAFSIHAIIIWFLVLSGFEFDFSYVDKPMVSRTLRYNSFWGNMEWASNNYFGISRAVGFFVSPDKLGRFLQYSAFLSFGYYILSRKYIYLLSSLLCFFAVILTLSAANIFSIFGVIIISVISKKIYNIKIFELSATVSFAVGCLTTVMVLSLIHGYFSKDKMDLTYYNQNQIDPQTSRITERLAGQGYKKLYHFLIHSDFQKPSLSKPFGHGFTFQVNNKTFMSQYAIERWINIGGIPILIIISMYFYHMFKVHVIPALTNKATGIVYYVALAYIAQTIMHLQHGQWWEPFYFYITAILVLLKHYKFNKNPNRVPWNMTKIKMAPV